MLHRLCDVQLSHRASRVQIVSLKGQKYCCYSPSETYGKKGADSNFQLFAELTVPPARSLEPFEHLFMLYKGPK